MNRLIHEWLAIIMSDQFCPFSVYGGFQLFADNIFPNNSYPICFICFVGSLEQIFFSETVKSSSLSSSQPIEVPLLAKGSFQNKGLGRNYHASLVRIRNVAQTIEQLQGVSFSVKAQWFDLGPHKQNLGCKSNTRQRIFKILVRNCIGKCKPYPDIFHRLSRIIVQVTFIIIQEFVDKKKEIFGEKFEKHNRNTFQKDYEAHARPYTSVTGWEWTLCLS